MNNETTHHPPRAALILAAALALMAAAAGLTACHPARQTLTESDTRHTLTADTLTRQAVTDLSGHKTGTESLRETIRDTTREQTWHARDTTFVLRVKTITRERNILARDTITLTRRDTLREAAQTTTETMHTLDRRADTTRRPTLRERLADAVWLTALITLAALALVIWGATIRRTRG